MGYYTPPSATASRPAVILWFRVYAIASALAVTCFLLLWQFLTPAGGHTSAHEWLGVLLLSSPFLLVYGIGALVPYKPWGWTYGLVVIALGLLGCFAPFSIILLIFWGRIEVKAAFRRI